MAKIKRHKTDPKDHWLDYSEEKHGLKLVTQTRIVKFKGNLDKARKMVQGVLANTGDDERQYFTSFMLCTHSM